MKLNFKQLLIPFVFNLITGCFAETVKGKQDLDFIDSYVYQDCNIYKVIIDSGNYSFRIAFSGSCKKLSFQDFYDDYKSFLNEYKDSIRKRSGLILRLEFYNEFGFTFQDLIRIKELTQLILDVELESIDTENGMDFTIVK